MPLTVDQLGKAIVASGLMRADELKALWAELPAGTKPKDGETFAQVLVAKQKVTDFQARELLSGSSTPLVLNQYVIVSKIGAGGMGQVFQAQHRKMKRLAAIKLLPPELVKDDEAVKRFQREVEAAAKLSHPNIVQTYDADECRGIHYLAMEYVEGRDLAAVARQRRTLPVTDVVNYVMQAARGLAFAHSKGVVHRDIKPANLLLDNEGVVKILDMGLARIDDAATQAAQQGLTQSGQVMGTVDYMAPEQAFDTRSVDARADIYSLGCTLYRLLTGQNIFDGETLVAKLMAHQTKPIPSLVARRPDIPQALESIYERMVAKSPDDRFQSMAEVEQSLATLLSPSPQTSTASPPEADSKFNAFLQSVTGRKKMTAPKASPKSVATLPSATTDAAPVDGTAPTMSLLRPLQATDPVSERSIQFAREDSDRALRKRRPLWKQPIVQIGGGVGAVLLVALTIWLINSGKDRNEAARPTGTDGGDVLKDSAGNNHHGKTAGAKWGKVALQSEISNSKSPSSERSSPYDLCTSPDYEWTAPENLGPLINSANEEGGPTLSEDGLTLIFEALDRAGGQGKVDLWMSRRSSLTEAWSEPENLGSVINTTASEISPALSADGLTLIYASDRAAAPGQYRLWFSTRKTPTSPWLKPTRLFDDTIEPAGVRSAAPTLSRDGLELLFQSNSRQGAENFDLWRSRRKTLADAWGVPEKLPPPINSTANDSNPELSFDGRVLLFASNREADRSIPLWWCSRPTSEAAWSEPQKIGGPLDSSYQLNSPALSSDGQTLIFLAWDLPEGKGKSDLWMIRRIRKPAAQPTPYEILTSPDYEWTEPENLGPGVNTNSYDHGLTISADGLSLVLASRRSGVQDLFECRRKSVDEPFGAAVPIKELNTPDWEGGPFLSADGLTLLYHSRLSPNNQGSNDLFQTRRRDRNSPWETPVNLGVSVNTDSSEEWPCLSPDGLTLLFASDRLGGKGQFDVWRSRRKSVDATFEAPENLGSGVNTGLGETTPKFATDNQTILFVRGGSQVPLTPFVAVLDTNGKLTTRPLNLPVIGHVNSPSLSPDSRTLYFTSDCPGGQGSYDGWQIRRVLTPAAAARVAALNKYVNSLGMEFVRVPKGKSWLGGGGGKPGTKEVEFQDDFYLGKFEVTQEEWTIITGKNPSVFSRTGSNSNKELVKGFSDDVLKRYPVESVSWDAAQEFIRLLNEKSPEPGWTYRLPKQDEWEYACRGGPMNDAADSAFDFYLAKPTNELLAGKANFGKLYNRPTGVGAHAPNRLGLHDMHGNVWEWCDDRMDDKSGVPQRVHCGGGWHDVPSNCRASSRYQNTPATGTGVHGLRVARVPIAGKWQPLFNGQDLTGWVGNLNLFSIANGELRPKPDGTGGWIDTQRSFGDFTLKAQIWVDGNSGIRLRSATTRLSVEIDPGVDGKGVFAMGRLDTPDQRWRAPTGKSFLRRAWCDLELTRRGTSVSLMLNGEPLNAADPSKLPELAQLTGPVVIGLEASAGTIRIRDFRVLEHSPTPEAAWQPLFNGKDLTGLKQRDANGVAEILVEDGQPFLRLQDKSNLTTRRFGDYHLRLEFRVEKGTIVNMVSDANPRLTASIGNDLSKASLHGVDMTYAPATIQSGRFVSNGPTIDSKQHPSPDPRGRLTFTNATPNPNTPWQRLEIIRLGDSCAVLLNGQLVAAVTNIRISRDGEPPKTPGPTEIGFTAYGGPASYRNIEIREITTLPPEVAP